MSHKAAVAALSALTAEHAGTFRVSDLTKCAVTPKQVGSLRAAGVVERLHPGVYRLTAVPASNEQRLRAALLWAGDDAVAAGRSAAELYRLEEVSAPLPEIVVPIGRRAQSASIRVHHVRDYGALMRRTMRGIPVTGIETTLVALAHSLEPEAFEVACEDARRRRLASVPAIRAYLTRWGNRGKPGVTATRALLGELDPVHASHSTLEVKTRRLLVAHGVTGFVREFPLDWNGR
ncbi:MAG: hypothetical protein JWL83_1528, partial [Actinomycetia bacterium]|nr:hypothetical protein [Actinomycetes bacterium]